MITICKNLYNELLFISSRIVPCCARVFENEETVKKYFIRPNMNSTQEVVDNYMEKRKQYIKEYVKGKIPVFCKNCPEYNPIEINIEQLEKTAFERIYINNRSKCSCRCVYCCLAGEENTEEDFKHINQEKTYDIKPILNRLLEKNLIDEYTQLYVCGGEPTENPDELEFLIDFAIEYKCKFVLFTNGIIYNEKIEKLMKNNKAEILCSIDSGSKKTYEKIKRVKAFDHVVNNITRYANAAKDNPNAYVRLKYIICPEINDNLDEFKKFIELAQNIGINYLCLSIDRYWLSKNEKRRIPNGIQEIVKYFHLLYDNKNLHLNVENSMLPSWYIDKILKNEKNKLFKIFELIYQKILDKFGN